MPQLKPKQIDKVIAAPIKLTALSVGSGVNNVIVTSQISTILSTAGNNGVSVPVQSSTTVFTPGIVVASPMNKSEIFDNTTKLPISDASGNEIYGRIVVVSSDYVLRFYYLNSGVETAYTTTSSLTIDFDFVYRFDFNTLPADALVSSLARNVMLDPVGQNAIFTLEKLTVISTNTLSALSNIPSTLNKTILCVNGKDEFCLGLGASFAISGTTITWNAGNAGYALETTDTVYVKYWL